MIQVGVKIQRILQQDFKYYRKYVYVGTKAKYNLENIETEWVSSEKEVRQGWLV